LLLVGDSRSSERDTAAFGHWLDTADRQRGGSKMFGHGFDTVELQRTSIETFCHWLDTPDRQRWVL